MRAGIAGAGIMGRLLALALLQKGWRVTLFDQHSKTFANCSMVAAGLLTPITELEKNHVSIFYLGQASLLLWPKIIEQIDQTIFFQQQGSLVISHQRDHAELNRFLKIITAKLSPPERLWQKLSTHALSDLEPDLPAYANAYYFANEAIIDTQQVMSGLSEFLSANIQWLENYLITDISSGTITGEDCSYHFDVVFDCRGLGGKLYFNDVRGVLGELIWLHAPNINLQRPVRLLHPRYSLYIVPRPNNIYILGASEIESNNITPISVRTTLELLSAAYSLHPGFADATLLKTAVHCRPTLNNQLPKIKYTDGLIAVNGLYRHGFGVAPALAADILQGLSHGIHTVNHPEIWEKLA